MQLETLFTDLAAIKKQNEEIKAALKENSSKLPKKVFTNQELTDYLKVSLRTLQTWRDNNELCFTQVGNKIFYTEIDLLDFFKKHRVKGSERFLSKIKCLSGD